jgi:hypothetical protein
MGRVRKKKRREMDRIVTGGHTFSPPHSQRFSVPRVSRVFSASESEYTSTVRDYRVSASAAHPVGERAAAKLDGIEPSRSAAFKLRNFSAAELIKIREEHILT